MVREHFTVDKHVHLRDSWWSSAMLADKQKYDHDEKMSHMDKHERVSAPYPKYDGCFSTISFDLLSENQEDSKWQW